MRIALFGENMDELIEWQNGLRISVGDEELLPDCYTDIELLKKNILSYDFVCTNREVFDRAFINIRPEVAFSWGKHVISCFVDDIYYAEAEIKEVRIHKETGEFMVHMPFSKVEELLKPYHFLKVHRSFIVNCRYISEIKNGMVLLKNGKECVVSKYRFRDIQREYIDYTQSCGINPKRNLC